jgi:lysophospholipase L1-like esterase
MTSLAAFGTRRPFGFAFLVTLLVAVALVAITACGSTPNPQPHLTNSTRYVALGDSYTSDSGAGPFTDSACFRSSDNYPNLLARKLSITDLADASCGGASSANLTEAQYPLGKGPNPPQLNAVTKDTELVTLGIGVNDAGLSSLLVACLPTAGTEAATCKPYLDSPDSMITSEIEQMGALIKKDLEEIRSAAPKARIILVGYPRLVPDDSNCDSQLPLPTKALDRLRASGPAVNDTLQSVAKSAGVDFIDMYTASAGHDVCSADPWVNGQRYVVNQALPYHPYLAYHVAVANKIYALLKSK